MRTFLCVLLVPQGALLVIDVLRRHLVSCGKRNWSAANTNPQIRWGWLMAVIYCFIGENKIAVLGFSRWRWLCPHQQLWGHLSSHVLLFVRRFFPVSCSPVFCASKQPIEIICLMVPGVGSYARKSLIFLAESGVWQQIGVSIALTTATRQICRAGTYAAKIVDVALKVCFAE